MDTQCPGCGNKEGVKLLHQEQTTVIFGCPKCEGMFVSALIPIMFMIGKTVRRWDDPVGIKLAGVADIKQALVESKKLAAIKGVQ